MNAEGLQCLDISCLNHFFLIRTWILFSLYRLEVKSQKEKETILGHTGSEGRTQSLADAVPGVFPSLLIFEPFAASHTFYLSINVTHRERSFLNSQVGVTRKLDTISPI